MSSNKNTKKICVVGDVKVGKSSLLKRYVLNRFIPLYLQTEGVDFNIKTLDTVKGEIRLQLWDVAGSDKFERITQTYIKDARFYILMFDVMSRSSFNSLKGWVQKIRKFGISDSPIILVGNKVDLISAINPRIVSMEEALLFMKDNDLYAYEEISAKLNIRVQDVFTLIINDIIDRDELNSDKPVGEGLDDPLLGPPDTSTCNSCKCCMIQ